MFNIGKVKLLPAREQVASVLRKAILSRELEEGQEITINGMAERIGVSSMPVREAFQILASEGYIKLRPNKGAVVQGMNEKTIKDHFETRALLESEAAARAALPDHDHSELKHIYQEAKESIEKQDYSNYSRQNESFHMAIWEAADNEKMKGILSQLWNGLSLSQTDAEEDYAEKSMKEHKDILSAILKGKKAEAKELMYHHIIRSMEDMLTHYADQ
ncbi:DNA-binding GntR family transcriptional regulator [Aequitasia blattaphilus]|uniref:GntR family transcriptional regulator n=1 Tax=Aequitasia blattaphilus TaxID=2949332 RepID=A0ABT1ED25_9FIRM|nr:GntR family transcriptional regulator [Aequitasia blattaphilus]MCP1103725.1 GntR family transcriptional regulator [Aequitasia blattaphilus]MCR8616365.1 GntR family transcriptional regulator [Aequitasia blattaphilus]